MRVLSFVLFTMLCFAGSVSAQSNIQFTNSNADQVLKGNFNPTTYLPTVVIDQPSAITQGIINELSTDTLKSYLLSLSSFDNRNTGSDTVSNTFGIGAARRWCYQKFDEISAANENRLQVSYLQFDEPICNVNQHRNIVAVLPGVGPQFDEVVIIEAHLDSRCEDPCDSLCMAHGMEDNGSGSALVLELCRVMSQYSYNRSIMFMLTIGEEQGLWGATATSDWCVQNNVKLNAVFNNDIVGGIICGETASPPGCPGLNDIDSVNVRLYSAGTYNSVSKSLARFTKLQYQEMVSPYVPVQTVINLMTPEDRTGRGGDHIPFRQAGFASVRFTSANEHGHGGPDSTYHDRQHTIDDVLGIDTNNDQVLDSFFVDFNYLKRNGIINGAALAMAATGPIPPVGISVSDIPNGMVYTLDDPNNYGHYRVGVRQLGNDWDTLYTFTSASDTLWGLDPNESYRIQGCTVDSNGIESLFSHDVIDIFQVGIGDEPTWDYPGVKLLQNKPNPFDEATTIAVHVEGTVDHQTAEIVVHDIQGRELRREPITLNHGMNEIIYGHENHRYSTGVFSYSLLIDGRVVATRQMVFAW